MGKHDICHVEFDSTDLERTRRFLGGLFGDWQFQGWGDKYLLFSTPGGPGGGINRVDKLQGGSGTLVHVEVDEIEPYLARVEGLGGRIHTPKTEIPEIGWFAIVKDPDGNLLGLYQDKPKG